jgi:Domain of unknown function (DUF4249)
MYKIQTRLLVGCAMLLLLFTHCIDEISLNDNAAADFFVVDGIMNYSETADSNDFVVKLGISRTGLIRPIPVPKGVVELVVNDKDSYPLSEREAGSYYLFRKDIFKVGQSYKLRFQVDGSQYESSNEVLSDSVTIQKAYADVTLKGTTQTASEIFVDVQDVPQKKNYYRWSFTQWEQQQYCLFCYVPAPRQTESCVEDVYATPGVRISRNMLCTGDCYDIINSTPNNAISDVFFDGRTLIRKSIGYIPYVFYNGCLVEVKQSSITPQYSAFLEILKSQAENTGGLADTPAALLTGNVKNLTNATQKIVGYFSVTNTTKKRIWVDRRPLAAAGYKPLSSLNPPLDAPTPTPPSWYPVACKPSKTRTNVKPMGWQ